MEKSFLLTKDIFTQAVEIVTPSIEKMISLGIIHKSDIYISAPDPTKPYGNCSYADYADIELFYTSFGSPKIKTLAVARSKAEVVWRTGYDSLYVQQFMPHLLMKGDTKWGGGIVLNGIIVAVSGLEEYYDIFVARSIAAACHALIARDMREIMASPVFTFMGVENPS